MNETFDDPTDSRSDIYCFDIDGTLTEVHEGTPFDAVPRYDRIEKVNALYDQGAIIYLQTARGFIVSSDMHPDDIIAQQAEADKYMRSRTEEQLKSWGVKYTKLFFGKPRASIYVDDRGCSDFDYFLDNIK